MSAEDGKAYRSGYRTLGPETEAQERLERAKRGLPEESGYAAYYCDAQQPILLEHQGYDPKQDRLLHQEPIPAPILITADNLLESWYWYRTSGRIGKALPCGVGEQGESADEALLSAKYVEDTPGYSYDVMRPILLHKLDGKPWAIWYGSQPKVMAKAMFDGFRLALIHRLSVEPLVIYRTKIYRPDHLEDADRANAA